MKNLFLLFLISVSLLNLKAQVIPKSLSERITYSDYIFEGEVIRSDSYDTQDGGTILTSSTIDIYKILKGDISCGTIEVLTRGGKVGDHALYISHNLKLERGMKGIFLCNETDRELSTVDFYPEDNALKLDFPYDEQGFIKYFEDQFNFQIYDYTETQLDSLARVYNVIELYTQLNIVDCQPNKPIINQTPHVSVSSTDTILHFTFLNSHITGTSTKYLEFDIALSANIPSTYFYFSEARLEYDTTTFSPNIWLAGKIWFTAGPLISDTGTYKDLQTSNNNNDQTRNIVNVPIIGKNSFSSSNLNYVQLSSNPAIAVHVKMEIDDCNHTSMIEQVFAGSGNYGQFSFNQHGGPYSPYHNFVYSDPVNFGGCIGAHIFNVVPHEVAGGIGDTVSISGTGFGNIWGTVFVKEADQGGAYYIELDTSDIKHWDNTMIKFVMPGIVSRLYGPNSRHGVPGSGLLKILTASNDSAFDSIKVVYSLYTDCDPITGIKENIVPYDLLADHFGIYFWYDTSIYRYPERKMCVDKAMRDWTCLSQMNFQFRDTITTNSVLEHYDSLNMVQFGPLPIPKLSETHVWAVTPFNCSKPYIWVDMIFADRIKGDLFCDTVKCDSLPYLKHDMYALALHEFGHALALHHVNDISSIMYYAIDPGESPYTQSYKRKVWLGFDHSSDLGSHKVIENSQNILTAACIGLGAQILPLQLPDCFLEHRLSAPMNDCHAPLISVEELNAENIFSIYPNPSDNALNVEMLSDNQTNYVIEIIDLTGRKALEPIQIKIAGKITFDISKFSAGIYFLKFTSDYCRATTMFVKN